MPLSIHNQESASENELFESGTGALADYFRAAGMAMPDRAAGCTSLHYMLERLPAGIPLLLVHNTFTRPGDLEEVSRSGRVVTWCFCPNANLYIERALPDFVMFHRAGARCCLGTDSYASNHQLSVLEEMKAVSRSAPSVPLKDLIDWATVNGARALGIDGWAGRIAAGFRPGINLIRDAGAERLSGDSSVQKLA